MYYFFSSLSQDNKIYASPPHHPTPVLPSYVRMKSAFCLTYYLKNTNTANILF